MAYVYAQHAHYVLLFLVMVVNSGFKFYGVTSHPFLCTAADMLTEVCTAADMLTVTLLVGFD